MSDTTDYSADHQPRMRPLAGLCALLLVSGLALLVWWRVEGAPASEDDPEYATAAAIEHDAVPTLSPDVPTERDAIADAASQRVAVATDRLGARVRGRLWFGDAALADARIDVWCVASDESTTTRVAQLRSAASGEFEIVGLADARHVILIDDERVPFATMVAEVQAGANADSDLGDLLVRAPGTLTARVVDRAGSPLVGVRVALVCDGWSHNVSMRSLLARGEAGLTQERRTDAEGKLHFGHVPPGRVGLLFDAPEFEPQTRSGEIVAGGVSDLGVVKLVRGRRVDGRVVDWTGAPIADATVETSGEISPGPKADRRTITDAEGRFVLLGLPTWDDVPLTIRAEGHVPIVCDEYAANGVTEFRLPRGFWVTGSVRGAPNTMTRVHVAEADGSDNQIPYESRVPLCARAHEVAADGGFRVGPFLPGRWKLWADAGAHGSSLTAEVIVDDADLELDLDVRQLTGLEVLVRDVDGVPVAGARVGWLDGENGPLESLDRAPDMHRASRILQNSQPSGKQLTTGAMGSARLPIDLDRPFAIAVCAEGGLAQARGFLDGQRPERVEFVLDASGGIRCQLIGDAATSVSVSAISVEDPRTEFPGKHSGDGRFEIRPLPIGRVAIRVHHGGRSFAPDAAVSSGERDGVLGVGYLTLDAPEIEVVANGTAQCNITLPTPGRLHGLVHWRGRPIAGCQVFALPPGDGVDWCWFTGGPSRPIDDDRPPIGAPVAVSGEDGSFGFDVMSAGTWQIYVRHPRGHVASGPWAVSFVETSQTVTLDLRLGGARVAVSIDPDWLRTWPTRGSREAFLFRAHEAGKDPSPRFEERPATAFLTPAKIDAEGHAAFDYVPAGDYVLRIRCPDGDTLQRGMVIGADTDITIGPLTAPTKHRFEVAITTPRLPASNLPPDREEWYAHRLALRVREHLAGIATPAHVAVTFVEGGRATLELMAGRYEVRALSILSEGDEPMQIDELGTPALLLVHPDGTFAPTSLDLR